MCFISVISFVIQWQYWPILLLGKTWFQINAYFSGVKDKVKLWVLEKSRVPKKNKCYFFYLNEVLSLAVALTVSLWGKDSYYGCM